MRYMSEEDEQWVAEDLGNVLPSEPPVRRQPAGPAIDPVDRRRAILEAISKELDRAYSKHGRDQWGRHEFYAILKEEVDELWDAIKADHPQEHVIMEAIQVDAMCVRYLETRDRYREPL